MKRRSKIVCTLGPSVASRDKISQLIESGMNVARINCSHGEWELRREWISWLRELSPESAPVAILVDLQGPKFRLGELASSTLEVTTGKTYTVGQNAEAVLPVPSDEIFLKMEPGDRLLLGDGEVELKLGSKNDGIFEAKALSGGTVKSRQGLTLVGKTFDVPALTEKDIKDASEASQAGVDYIALSYVRRASDLRELRRLVDQHDPGIRLCAKIETRDAIKEIDEILKCADAIMVARGDMGLQMDIEEVPLAQKRIIEKCNRAGKPVITATQMLESMVKNARPTRAEATDVANAILDGTDAVMLSGETANGAYPLEALRTMARVAEKAESLLDHDEFLEEPSFSNGQHACTSAVAHAAARLSESLKVKAILTTTTSGQTARMVSRFRPRVPILCATWDKKTHAQMALVWGVEAIYVPLPVNTDEIVEHAIDGFLRAKKLKIGDTVVVTAGVPAGTAGNTNLILVQAVK